MILAVTRTRWADARAALREDIAANHNSAKGRLVMRLFRLGQALPPAIQRPYQHIYYLIVDVLMGISLPLRCRVGPGLVVRHGQGLVVSWRSVIGSGCELHQNVTLGEKDGRAPILESGVVVGANAVLLGGINIGHDARIGAGAVVTVDISGGAVAVGPLARIIDRKDS